MPEPDCFLRYRLSGATRNFTSGKSDVYVLAAAARRGFNMVLFTEPVSRRNTFVGGTYAPPSALLVTIALLVNSCQRGCDARTKWKRQTSAPMRAEQLRNHSCDEKGCPGARRLYQNPGALHSSTPTSSDVVSSFCRHCDVVQGLTGGSTVAPVTSDDSEIHRQTSSTSLTGQLLSRLYLGTLQLPFANYCRL